MHLSTKGMFLYNNKLYQRVDGDAIGCPMTPTVANFLLKHMETIMLKRQKLDQYMDDIYALFDDDNACTSFLKVLRNQHINNLFTTRNLKILCNF